MESRLSKKRNQFSIRRILDFDPAALFGKKEGQPYDQIQVLVNDGGEQLFPINVRTKSKSGNFFLSRRKHLCVEMVQEERTYTLQVKPTTFGACSDFEVAENTREAQKTRQNEIKSKIELEEDYEGEDLEVRWMGPYLITDYNLITEIQLDILEEFVKGKEIHDLCAGNNALAKVCCALGAKKVTTIDYTRVNPVRRLDVFPNNQPENIVEIQHDLSTGLPSHQNIERAIIASPPPFNYTTAMPDWEGILPKIPHILYFGGNSKGNHPCGNPKLWRHLIGREITNVHVRNPGAVIQYGPNPRKGHQILREEALGLIHPGPNGNEKSRCIGEEQAIELMEILQIPYQPA